MITPSSSNTEKTAAGAAEIAAPKKSEPAKKAARTPADETAAVKVEISDEGRAAAKGQSSRKEKEAEEAVKTREEKEADLLKFYAKRLVKASKELDKSEEAAIQKEIEDARAEAEAIKSSEKKPAASKLPTP